jgi:hypothetical protein
MKRYYKVKKNCGDYTGETFVREFVETDEASCVLCRGMKDFICDKHKLTHHKRFVRQCEANLRSHLATGKHWKVVKEYYIKSR